MGGQPSTVKQISETKLPAWVEKASESNYNLAQQIANKPFVQYMGDRVADVSNFTKDAWSLLKKNIGAQDPLYENAASLYGAAASPFDPTGYLNPFIENVETRAIDNANRSITGQLAENADKARAAKSFGGSRAAIVDAVTRSEGARSIGDLSAQLRKEGYDTAVSNMFTDREGMRASAAGFLNTSSGRQESVFKDIAGLLGAGDQERGYRQSLIDADREKFNEAQNYDTDRLNVLLSTLGMSPYGKSETTTKTGQQGSSGMDWATTILGLGKLFMGLSDRRDKTDIEELGVDDETGLPMYAYRYKKDPKNTPKIVGPMAQDVEKVAPHLVREIGGHKVIVGVL